MSARPAGATTAKPNAKLAGSRRPAGRPLPGLRWLRVGLLVGTVMVGLPLAHALLGEAFALLGGAAFVGFLLGRWTAPAAARRR